jgi:glutamyl-tRNA synthetase
MTPIVRFAPSPTGHLHAGNLRTAIINWLFVVHSGGKFLLRLDDTDKARSREEYAHAIRADLAWLGIEVAGEERQSLHLAAYDAAMVKLKAAGRVYPCFESAQELEMKRKIQLGRGLPPIYDRAALALTPDECDHLIARGKKPHWRFKLDTSKRMVIEDLVQGHVEADPASLSDPIVRREDGSYLYMLPSVIDDIDMGITHVVRGQDHLTNSAIQTQMFEALGAEVPAFAHLALLSTRSGELSKRLGSAGVAHYQEMGIEALTLIAYLGRLGTSDPIEPVISLDPLSQSFGWEKFNKANAYFDEQELVLLNQKILHHLPFAAVQARLSPSITPEIWAACQGNLNTLADMESLSAIINGPITPLIEDSAFIEQAHTLLAQLSWGDDIWRRWTEALKNTTGRKGKALFLPLRLALTGVDTGPDMPVLMRLIGREAALARLAQR